MKGLRHTPCPANRLGPEAANGIMSSQQPGLTFLATVWRTTSTMATRDHAHTGTAQDDYMPTTSIPLTMAPSYLVMCRNGC